LADLDPGEFARFRRLCRAAGDDLDRLSDEDILKALGLAPLRDPVSLGAVLLFGLPATVQRWVPMRNSSFKTPALPPKP
jgi:ATP-dependent DNA helicase RecG